LPVRILTSSAFLTGFGNYEELIKLNRDKAYFRNQRHRAIKKKKGICKRLGGSDLVYAWVRDNPGRLSKGKIHCSCWMCRLKSYDNKSHSDKKKDESYFQQLSEL